MDTDSTLLKTTWALLVAKYIGQDVVAIEGESEPFQSGLLDVSATRPLTDLFVDVKKLVSGSVQYRGNGVGSLFAPSVIEQDSVRDYRLSLRLEDPAESSGSCAADHIVLYPVITDRETTINIRHEGGPVNETQLKRFIAQLECGFRSIQLLQDRSLVADVEFLSAADIEQLAVWNSSMPEPLEATFHDLVSQRAAEDPEKIAIEAGDGSLRYKQLDQLSSSFAQRLRSLGIGSGDFVPTCFERSKWNIVAALAVLKAGAAFVPIDPQIPSARVQSVVQQCDARVALVSDQLTPVLDAIVDKVLTVDEVQAGRIDDSLSDSRFQGSPNDACYVIFTSGSTGTPKGIVIEHRGICTSMAAVSDFHSINRQSRVLQFASHAFDLSIMEYFAALMQGGTVCIAGEEERLDDLGSVLRRQRITYAVLTPSFARTFDSKQVHSLDSLTLGGETILTRDVMDHVENVRQLNGGYGPSEVSCASAAVQFRSNTVAADNIGRPVGCIKWIVSPADATKLVPIGTVGEILIEGPTVGRGYVKMPERTAQVFITTPSWLRNMFPDRHERLYKTGDLARYNPDGSIQYIGRVDTQVKLRGFRVELSEIEDRMRRALGGSADIVVDIVSFQDAQKVLVGFVSERLCRATEGEAGIQLDLESVARAKELGDQLRAKTAEALPFYMLPSAWCLLSVIPHTVSGKCDRSKLRAWAANCKLSALGGISSSNGPAAPANEEESILHDSWATVLSERLLTPAEELRFGREANFFESGADSLLAIKLASLLRKERWSLSVKDIFRNPQLKDMAAVIRRSTSGMKEVVPPFSLLQAPKSLLQEVSQNCDVAGADIVDCWPCSPFQSAVLVASEKTPGAYIMQHAMEIPQDISDQTIVEAWRTMQKSDSSLRSCCVQTTRGAMQVVLRGPQQELPSLAVEVGTLEQLLADSKKQGIIPRKSLYEAFIIHDGDRRYLALTMHHAFGDLWSVSRLVQRLRKTMRDQQCQAPSTPALLSAFLLGMDQSQASTAWAKYLEGIQSSPFPPLPAHNYRPRSTGFEYDELVVTKPIIRYATVATLVRAAWALIIAQYTSALDEVVFGSTVNGRSLPIAAIEELAGPCVATVPVRARLPQSSTKVYQYVRRLQDEYANVMAFEQAGLPAIAESSADAATACEFQNLLVIQPGDDPMRLADDLAVLSPPMMLDYALVMNVSMYDDRFIIAVTFDENVIHGRQIRRLIRQFGHVYRQLCASDQNTSAQDIDFLPPEDAAELALLNSNISEPKELSVTELIESQVKQNAAAPAVCSFDGDLSYGDLNDLAERLAGHLQQNYGLGPGNIVPYCFHKSLWSIVAILAALKSGAAITAIDPSWPIERIRELLHQTNASLVLGDEDAAVRLESVVDTVLVNHAQLLDLCTDEPLLPAIGPRDLLFIIFTSGTTGVPKGIMIDHGTFATSISNHASPLHLNSHSRVFQYANFIYDVSMSDILSTLTVGGCICIPSEFERLNDPAGALQRRRANWACLTPTLAAELNPDDVPGLEHLIFVGEAATAHSIAKWADCVCLHYQYGPAECSVFSNGRPGVKPDHEITDTGYAYQCGLWIVDPDNHHKLRPIGATGEIVIEGNTVGSGYLNSPAQTAAAFITNPKWALPCDPTINKRKFYKTGDLGRFGVDAALHVIGRKDTQVKIRGRRVELGEVEHHLRRCLTIPCAVAVDLVRTDGGSGTPTLAAFVCPKNEVVGAEGLKRLREQLQSLLLSLRLDLAQSLPHHMLPSLFIPIAAIPRSPSGKLDRSRLRRIAADMSYSEILELSRVTDKIRPPTTESAKKLLEACATILRVSPTQIGLDDNWFLAGGDSVLAMRLIATLRNMQYDLTVRDVFEAPTFDVLATRMKIRRQAKTATSASSPFALIAKDSLARNLDTLSSHYCLPRHTVQDIYPATPLQEGLWALTRKHSSAYHAQLVARLPSTVDLRRYRNSWASTMAAYDIMRTVFVNLDNGLHQVVLNTIPDIDEEEVQSLGSYLDDDANTLHADGHPISRFSLVHDLSNGERSFVWSTHHALYDGSSLQMIVRAVEETYLGQTIPQVVQFRDFIGEMARANHHAADEFWRQALDNPDTKSFPSLPSPVYKPKPSAHAEHHFQLPQTAASRFTTATTLQAAWSVLLCQCLGTNDVCFASIVSGRAAGDLASDLVMGPTLATVPFRTVIAEHMRIGDLLQQTSALSVASLPYEQTGLQHIAKLSPGAAAACDLRNAFVVQPGARTPQSALAIQYSSGSLGDFYTYPLNVECYVDSKSVQTVAYYDDNIIDETQMYRLLRRFEHICHELVTAERSTRVSDIPLTDEDESQILEWNQHYPARADLLVQDIFDEAVRKHPYARAIAAWDGNLTFQEVHDLSIRTAVWLLERGVTPGSRVLFGLEKSKYGFVWILAILRAGGAVVPLDPVFPEQRIKLIASVTSSAFAVASQASLEIMTRIVPKVVLGSDMVDLRTANRNGNSLPKIETDAIAMIYFTSGSTGIPKAVPQRHYMISTSVTHQVKAWALPPGSRVLQFASNTFDTFLVEALGAFLQRSILCVPSEENKMSNLQAYMSDAKITVAYLTPTVVRMLDPHRLPHIHTMFVTGEALTQDIVTKWADKAILRNAYGITETMLSCTLTDAMSLSSNPANIGRPYSCVTWIANKSDINRLVPVGTPGELIIEGPCVALEYLNDEKRSAEAFIEAPAWLGRRYPSRSGQKVYRSFDLARYSSDGTIEYIARANKDEVKIRGQRVNLGEVEYHLSHCLPDGNFGAVDLVQFDDNSLGTHLVGFVHVSDGQEPSESSHGTVLSMELYSAAPELRKSLRELLPERICPTLYLRTNQLPVTPSGKLDRNALKRCARALRVADLIEPQQPGSANRPMNSMELRLRNIWAQLLGIEPTLIALDTNLFHIGGDSIIAMRLAARAYSDNIDLTVGQIFKTPVLANMAESVPRVNTLSPQEIAPFSLLPSMSFSNETLTEIGVTARSIAIDDIEDAYPCSQMQHGLLAASDRDPMAYIAHWMFNIPETMDFNSLEAAWLDVASRHAMLRTRFVQTSEGILQVVLKDSRTVFADAHASGPAFLVDLTNFEAGRMDITAHHATFDGWMMPLLLNDLADVCYGCPLKPVVPYNRFIDYASQQRNPTAEAYWRSALDGAVPPDFPEMVPDFEPRTNALAQHTFELSSRVRSEITTASLACAAWALLISKYSCSTDVVFGHALTGRAGTLPGIQDIVGPTIVSVPLRVNVKSDLAVSDYLNAVQRQIAEGIPYEQYGLRNIRHLGPQYAPLCDFKTLLVVQTIEEGWGQRLGLTSGYEDRRQIHPQAINIQCIIRASQVRLEANYDDHLCSTREMCRMLEQMDTIMQLLSGENNNIRLQEVDILSRSDRQDVVALNSRMPETVDQCMHVVIEKNAIKQPAAPAICAWDGDLTYSELDAKATQLAYHLHETFQLQPDDVVLLHFEKSKWTAVSMYGVQKAGCAYGFLGLTDPLARIEDVVKTTHARVILASETLQRKLTGLPVDVMPITPRLFDRLPEPVVPIQSKVSPHNLAYILFTSGSTGVPKAVMIEHSAGTTSAFEHGRAECVTSTSRVYQFASYTFDVSTSETLTTLILGGCVCIPSEDQRINDLAGSINRFNVNHAFLTPTVVSLLDPTMIPNVEVLKLGGEALTRENVAIWASKVKLSNSYGVCEAAIRSCFRQDITPDTDFSNCGSAVGCALWICDPNDYNLLVPFGAVGELAIEGPTLARGYMSDPAKTAEAFVRPRWLRDLFPDRPQLVYRTGDLVRYAEDGTVRFVGRADTQVKLHGQRIELREIEHRITASATAGLSAVVVPKRGTHAGKLVGVLAFSEVLVHDGALQILSREKATPNTFPVLETQLSQTLPPHMVPHIWIPVEGLPINFSGKMDRLFLSRWVESLSAAELELIESLSLPQEDIIDLKSTMTSVESTLRDIWVRVLNVSADDVNVRSNFFRLGGDSISAMQIAGLARVHGLRISMLDIMTRRVLSEIALTAEAAQDKSVQPDVIHRSADDTIGPFPLSPIQTMFFDQSPFGSPAYQQGIFVRMRNTLDAQTLSKALAQVVRRHAMLRARYRRNSCGAYQQTIEAFSASSYDFREVPINHENEIPGKIRSRQQLINCQNGPTFIATQLSSSSKQYLHLTAHHLVTDLVSWRIVLQNIEDILRRRPLPPPSVSFPEWSSLQQKDAMLTNPHELGHGQMLSHDDFWGMIGKSNTVDHIISQQCLLSAASTASILQSTEQTSGATPVDIMLGVLAFTFHQTFSDRDGPDLYNEGHGREPLSDDMDLSDTVGWFSTRCPIAIPSGSLRCLEDCIRAARHARRSAKHNGRAWFASRHYHPEGQQMFGRHQRLELSLNYRGLVQQLERQDAMFESTDVEYHAHDPHLERFGLIEVDVMASHAHFTIKFEWNSQMTHQQELGQWASLCKQTFDQAQIWTKDLKLRPTSIDFPLVDISNDQLDKLLDAVTRAVSPEAGTHVEDLYPASHMQKALLLASWRDTQSYRVRLYLKMKLSGTASIDMSRLITAWQCVVNRHAALRTVLFADNDICQEPLQVVLRNYVADSVAFEAVDEQAAIQNHRSRPWDDEMQPAHRAAFYRLADRNAVCGIDMAHTLTDAWSCTLLANDLAAAYDGQLADAKPTSLRGFIQYLTAERSKANLEYWTQYLSGVQPCILPAFKGLTRAKERVTVDRSLASLDYERFCQRHSITHAVFFQTVYALTLRLFTGMDDVVFAYASSGRGVPVHNVNDTVGAFISMLICRCRIRTFEPILALFQNMQGDNARHLEHEHFSMASLQHALGLAGKPFFNATLSVHAQVAGKKTSSSGSRVHVNYIGMDDPTEFALTTNVLRADSGIHVEMTGDPKLLSKGEVDSIADTFYSLSKSLIANPEANIDDIDIMTQPEQDKLLQHHRNSQIDSYVVDRSNPDHLLPVGAIGKVVVTGAAVDRARLADPNATQVTFIRNLSWSNGIKKEHKRKRLFYYSGYQARVTSIGDFEIIDPHANQVHPVLPSVSERVHSEPDAAVSHIPKEPMNNDEAILREIWAKVLRVDVHTIGLAQSFFELGGDSVSAMRVSMQCRKAGLRVCVRDILKYVCIRDILDPVNHTATMSGVDANKPLTGNPDIKGTTPPTASNEVFALARAQLTPECVKNIIGVYPAAPMQQHMLALEEAVPGICTNFVLFNIHGIEGSDVNNLRSIVRSAWQQVVDRHDILRTVFIFDKEKSGKQQWAWQAVLKNVLVDIKEEWSDRDVVSQKCQDLVQPQAQSEPGHDLMLYHAHDGTLFGVLRISHMLDDAVSRAVLYRDLALALNGTLEQNPSLSFGQTQQVLEAMNKDSYAFWDAYTLGVSPCHLTIDERIASHSPLDVIELPITLPSPASIRTLGSKLNITTGNVLMAAWSIVLFLHTASPTVCFDYISTGRDERVDTLDEAMGPYFNLHLSKMTLTPRTKLVEVLRQAKVDFVNTVSHQGVSSAAVAMKTGRPLTTFANTAVNFIRDCHLTGDGGDADGGERTGGEVRLEQFDATGSMSHDYMLLANESQGNITVQLLYKPSVVSEERARDTCRLLTHTLEELTSRSETTVIDDLAEVV